MDQYDFGINISIISCVSLTREIHELDLSFAMSPVHRLLGFVPCDISLVRMLVPLKTKSAELR